MIPGRAEIEAWLDGRDADAAERAWDALGARWHPETAGIAPQAAVLLVEALFGWPRTHLQWLLDPRPPVGPGSLAQRCWLEGSIDVREELHQSWDVARVRRGSRGVDRVLVGFGIDDGTRDGAGSGAELVRIYDLDAGWAVSVLTWGRAYAIVAPEPVRAELEAKVAAGIDRLRWTGEVSIDTARGQALLASLGALVDPRYASVESWTGVTTRIRDEDPKRADLGTEWAWRSPDGLAVRLRSLTHANQPQGTAWMEGSLEGLPWGCAVQIIGPASRQWRASVTLILPRAALDAVIGEMTELMG